MKHLDRYILCLAVAALMLCGNQARATTDTNTTVQLRVGSPWVLRGGFHDYDSIMRSPFYPQAVVRIGHRTLPHEADGFAALFNCPTVGIGASWEGARFAQRKGSTFPIHLFTLYAFADATLATHGRFRLEADLGLGAGINTTVYDPKYNPLMKNFSSALLINVQGGLDAWWRLSTRCEVGLAFVFAHLSTGRLAYPNGGWNTLCTALSLRWGSEGQSASAEAAAVRQQMRSAFRRHWNFEPFAGGGVHNCAMEWMVYGSTQPWPNYLIGLNANYMMAPHYSMGLAIDLTACTHDFLDRLRNAETIYFGSERVAQASYHWPTAGIGWIGQIYYGNLSFYGVVGAYVYRQLGVDEQEGALYQKVGLKYVFPKLNNIFIAADCKAHHFSRAAIVNFTLGVRLERKRLAPSLTL